MSGLVIKNNNELWFNNNKLSTSTGTKGLYLDINRNLFFNNAKIASGNLSNPLGLHLINNELAYDGTKFGSELNVLIRSLFAKSEQGFAFDFNDLSTMYQDSAGTIPVTGAGQPVGKVLDKSGRGNHATQSTSAKRPILQQNTTTGAYYLSFDGVDDCLVTSNITWGTDAVTVFSGINKLNDKSNYAMVCEFGAVYNTNQSFNLQAPNTAQRYAFESRGSAYTTAATNAIYPPPHKAVLVGQGKVSTNLNKLRVNATNAANNSVSQGNLLNYGSFVLNISSRNAGESFYSGHLYSLVGISRLATDAEITNSENAIAKNVGVTL